MKKSPINFSVKMNKNVGDNWCGLKRKTKFASSNSGDFFPLERVRSFFMSDRFLFLDPPYR